MHWRRTDPYRHTRSGVDLDPFGSILREPTVEALMQSVMFAAGMEATELKRRANEGWAYVQKHQKQERFGEYLRALENGEALGARQPRQ